MTAHSPAGVSKRLRYRIEWFVVRLIAAAVPRLPRRLLHCLADFLGALAAHFHWYGRQVAFSNLKAVFPEMPHAQRRTVVRKSYQYFARGQADLLSSVRLTPENVRDFIDVSDIDRLKNEHGDRAFIFSTMHYGGFEWIAVALGLCGVDCTVVTQSFKNELLEPIYNRLREVSGHQTIRREGALLRLAKTLRAGSSVGFAVDLTIPPKLPSIPIRCLGLQTCVTVAHAFLHRRSGAPIVPAYCEPIAGGRYRLALGAPLAFDKSASDEEIVQACWDFFETVIRRNPAPWLWMYKHWRYHPAHATESYPSYANESSWFEYRLAQAAKAFGPTSPSA